MGENSDSSHIASSINIDAAVAETTNYLDSNQSVDVEEEEIEEGHEEQLLPPDRERENIGANCSPGQTRQSLFPSLDVPEQFLCRDGQLDVDKELDGSEDREAPEHHWQVEIGVDVTAISPFSNSTSNLGPVKSVNTPQI